MSYLVETRLGVGPSGGQKLKLEDSIRVELQEVPV
jgi:hypothetical protein